MKATMAARKFKSGQDLPDQEEEPSPPKPVKKVLVFHYLLFQIGLTAGFFFKVFGC